MILLTIFHFQREEPETGEYTDYEYESPLSSLPIIDSLNQLVFSLLEMYKQTNSISIILTEGFHYDSTDYYLKLDLSRSKGNLNCINIDVFYHFSRSPTRDDDFFIESFRHENKDFVNETPLFYEDRSTYIEGWDVELDNCSNFRMTEDKIKRRIKMEKEIDIFGKPFWKRTDIDDPTDLGQLPF